MSLIPAPARRLTPQRTGILAELRAAHDHPTAAELHGRLRPSLRRLSLGTVYRNLDVLAAEGQVSKLTGSGAETRYDGRLDAHDHARCRSCGAIADIPRRATIDATGLPEGFLVESHRLEYLGVCAQCRADDGHWPLAVRR